MNSSQVTFVTSSSGSAHYSTPEELYPDLPRRNGAVPGLWSHQADLLRNYVASSDKPDVAIELPTGTGKTLTGLLIAEWRRRNYSECVLYACPTRQLASQVAKLAYKEGIDVSVLVGPSASWDRRQLDMVDSQEAIGLTTYSSIFNSSPKVPRPGSIVFDDAHAASQYVGNQYSLRIVRRDAPDLYLAALQVLAPQLDLGFVERMRASSPDPQALSLVRLVLPLRQSGLVEQLSLMIGALDTPLSFQASMIRNGLASCLIYVAYTGVTIRPLIPPTYENEVFSLAHQRLYMSATLGNGGELERSFGRQGIFHLALPSESPEPRQGRRFFIFPELCDETDSMHVAREIVTAAGKALVLAPTTELAMSDASALAQDGWPVMGIEDVRDGMEPFAVLPNGTCGLAARYDGLDLPGDSCRVVVLDGLPDKEDLQEMFLKSRARAAISLGDRVRTRVVQGLGRCTRGPGDSAIVVVLGSELTRYFSRPDDVEALDPELQAEIKFGRDNSRNSNLSLIIPRVIAFLDQETSELWRETAEPALRGYRRDANRTLPLGVDVLSATAELEVEAWALAGSGSWHEAARKANEVVRRLEGGGDSLRGYRAFWLYLEAAWLDQTAAASGDGGLRAVVEEKLRLAQGAAGSSYWIREMAPFAEHKRGATALVDKRAVSEIAAKLNDGFSRTRMNRELDQAIEDLARTPAGPFEAALTTLGSYLGADARKPSAPGRCDSVWCWGSDAWIALEAKSEHSPGGSISLDDVRQSNPQLRLLAADRNSSEWPPLCVTLIISPRSDVTDDGIAIAEPELHLVAPSTLREIAENCRAAWRNLLTSVVGLTESDLKELVEREFQSYQVLPTQLFERLTQWPIGTTPREPFPED